MRDYAVNWCNELRFAYTLCSEKTPTHIFFHISMSNV